MLRLEASGLADNKQAFHSWSTKPLPRMCSVLGCDSGRRRAQRFKLPEDPERRLKWVQFLFEVNGQRLKESSWTDITICTEHFIHDCFENMFSTTGTVQLKQSAVPSLCIKSEPEEDIETPHVEPVKKTDVTHQWDDLDTRNSSTSCSEKTQHIPTDPKASPASIDVSDSCSPHVSNSVTTATDQTQQKNTIDLNIEEAALLQRKGKVVVNESCLLQLFCRRCPSCSCKVRMEKLTYGALVIFNQQCLQCDYKYQWKSQVNASIPTPKLRALAGGAESQQEKPTDDGPSGAGLSEMVTFSDENSDPVDEDEEGDDAGESSDGEWNPTEDALLEEQLTKELEETGAEDKGEEEEIASPGGLKINELCTECGRFFNILKPHKCEHKIKPYSCNVCGKRCIREMSLRVHSKIHEETYEHPCKYCHITFRTRGDKCKHEQVHQDEKDPYMCPDCPETFATNKERGVHLANHRSSREFRCGVCGIDFKDLHHLRRHSVVHTGLKPYKCSVCQRDFNQASNLKSHMRLHTGERPYKCPHCDQSFNHNVSLKSHVQRCHMSRSGCQRKKENQRASDAVEAEVYVNKKGTESDFDDVEEEQETEEKVQKKRRDSTKNKRRTGRPRGRPKRSAEGHMFLAEANKGRRSNAENRKSQVQNLTETGSGDEQSDGGMRFDSAAAKEAEEKKMPGGRSRGRPKNNSDSDLVKGEETKKKKHSVQISGRGRPKKNVPV